MHQNKISINIFIIIFLFDQILNLLKQIYDDLKSK